MIFLYDKKYKLERMINMREGLKDIILMGIGAISMTGEKAAELKQELLKRGASLYVEGAVKNEELKREIKEKIKENTNIQYKSVTEEDLVDIINSLSDEEKEKITELLKNKRKCKDNDDNEKNEENKEG